MGTFSNMLGGYFSHSPLPFPLFLLSLSLFLYPLLSLFLLPSSLSHYFKKDWSSAAIVFWSRWISKVWMAYRISREIYSNSQICEWGWYVSFCFSFLCTISVRNLQKKKKKKRKKPSLWPT
jgi:hypothetical protein